MTPDQIKKAAEAIKALAIAIDTEDTEELANTILTSMRKNDLLERHEADAVYKYFEAMTLTEE